MVSQASPLIFCSNHCLWYNQCMMKIALEEQWAGTCETSSESWWWEIVWTLELIVPYSCRKSRRREPAPGFKKTYRSVLLGRKLNIRVTLGVQRAIERAGGFDRYIYYTPEDELRSKLAVSLKQRMNRLVAKYPSVEPPPLDKRNPKPLPKKLLINVEPIEVCKMTKYVYLG